MRRYSRLVRFELCDCCCVVCVQLVCCSIPHDYLLRQELRMLVVPCILSRFCRISVYRTSLYLFRLYLAKRSCSLVLKLGVELIAAADGWDVEA